MCRVQALSVACVLLISVATIVQGDRTKRQSADVRTAEYLAWIALQGDLGPGCDNVACGVVDVDRSGKRKRNGKPGKRLSATQRNTLLRKIIQNATHRS